MQPNSITLGVAPMEGVMDHIMRQLLSEIGGMDYFVSEFVRVTQYPIPKQSFRKLIPEISQHSTTPSGHPVHTQLLGSNPQTIAMSALQATQAGAKHIDVNFGCPAKRVNGHGGGSVLLTSPETLYEIISTIKQAIPNHIHLSAKIRLGFNDESLLFENVAAIEAAGAQSLAIHGRTRKDGYKPPARWEKIGEVRQKSKMTIIANGDIRDTKSLERCIKETGCYNVMIGRGALANPFIFREIRSGIQTKEEDRRVENLIPLITRYIELLAPYCDTFATMGRLKQWCFHLRTHFPTINDNIQELRRAESPEEFINTLYCT